MAVGVGDILFTALFSDAGTGGTDGSEGFSFVATTAISAGETITFNSPDDSGGVGPGNSFFEYTVGVGGLQSANFVRFTFNTTGTPTIIQDPSGGSVGPIQFTGGQTGLVFASADNLIASSGGEAIAAITTDTNTAPLTNANLVIGMSTTAINAAIATPTDPLPVTDLDEFQGQFIDDNAIWIGDAFSEIDDPANWRVTNDPVNHASPNILGATFVSQEAATPCFLAGSLIACPSSEIPVEALRCGDCVLTPDGSSVAVRWIGQKTVRAAIVNSCNAPVRIRAGALGDGLPHSDLTVTADHGMILDGFVINASALVNGNSIDWVPLADLPDTFTVYHIETEAHDVILANGAASETFIDYRDRRAFDNFDEYLNLYETDRLIPEMPATRISARRHIPAAICKRLGIPTCDSLALTG